MIMRPLFFVGVSLFVSLNVAADPRETVDVHRTAYGVVHVDAQSDYGAAYGLAYAYASDNVCLLADYVVTVNGERSRFFDPAAPTTVGLAEVQNLTSDRFFRYYLDDEALIAAYATIPAPERALLRGYVAGFNAYLRDAPKSALPMACRDAPWVRPLTDRDMYRMLEERAILSSGSALLEGIVGASPPDQKSVSAQAVPLPVAAQATLGSNGWAFGADVTAHGGGLLMANPHFPWESISRMYQVHLRVAGQYDVMGATLPPYPAVTIGFNSDVAWTHTVSTAQRFTLFELRLASDDPKAYYVDGQRMQMTERVVDVPVREPNGSTRPDRHTVFETIHGPVVSMPAMGFGWTRERAYAMRDVNRHNVDGLATWRNFARAKSVADIRNALAQHRAISWVNTIAADRDGNTMFADISRVPNISRPRYDECKVAASQPPPAPVVLDGSRTACRWYTSPGDRAWLPVADMPVTQRRDYVANSNDSYWLVNATAPKASLSPILGPTAIPQRLRTRIGLLEIERRIGERQHGLDSAEVEAMLFSNRNHSGELFADDVVALCSQNPGRGLSDQQRTDVAAACTAVRRWDRRNELDSRGAAMFREFWQRAKDIDSVYAIAFNAADPTRTPRGLNWREPTVRVRLIAALAEAAALIRKNGFAADARLGDIQAVTRNERRIPIHGGAWYDGVLNLNLTRELTPAGYVPYDGASYIQIVSLGRKGPTAHGLLAYGQSTDPQSPHFSDQTERYSLKQLYLLPYTQQQIQADPAHRWKRLTMSPADGR